MARLARVVVPGIPHHVVQRGNRNQQVFFADKDRMLYLDLLKEHCREAGLAIWAYCLMFNHVHLVTVPQERESLAQGMSMVHREYTWEINHRNGWKGYLWQGRFSSYPLDQKYLYAAVRYIELNPVKAGLVKRPEEYRWSSARAHVLKLPDAILSKNFLTDEIGNWSDFLMSGIKEESEEVFDRHLRSGKPLGGEAFLAQLETLTGRKLSSGDTK